MTQKHKDLRDTAIRWLYEKGCHIYAKEVPTENGNADALGIKAPRNGRETVYYIEAKASRNDLICLKQKQVYRRSVGAHREEKCYLHMMQRPEGHLFTSITVEEYEKAVAECKECFEIRRKHGDTGIDYYYLIVADGVKVEEDLYPGWGIINEKGEVVRRAKRMKREGDCKRLIIEVAHVLVYKCFGKLYLGEYNGDTG